MSYELAKSRKAELEAQEKAASDALLAFPRASNGLTPDSVKSSPEWQTAYARHAQAFAALRNFNQQFFRVFKKEARQERIAKAKSRTAL